MQQPETGLKVYLVGGAVRDRLLGLAVHERDWLVVGATPDIMLARGFTPVGKDFPVFLHPVTHEEYALARTERKSGHGYGGFVFHAAPDVTLEEDLVRRDLTINAMAMDADGKLIDPLGGARDLAAKTLRHVAPAFTEDPLRVLRVARFQARFQPLGFTVAEETLALMRTLSASGELDHLVAERVWKETARALMEPAPEQYFRILHTTQALAVLFPEIAALDGVPQAAQHHPEIDTLAHLYLCLASAAAHASPLAVRYAILCHDLGKGATPVTEWPKHHGHETRGIHLVKNMNTRLAVPKELAEIGLLVTEFHTHCHRALELRPETLARLFKALDYPRRPERLDYFLDACRADARGRLGFTETAYPQADLLAALAPAMRVDTAALLGQGLTGSALGIAIGKQQQQQLEEAKRIWLAQHS